MDIEILGIAQSYGMLNPLDGSAFCMTGKLSVVRHDLQRLIIALGGTIHDDVRGSTDYLIVPNEGVKRSSKYNAALFHGTEIISEEEFCNMILPSVEELRSKS